MLKLVLLLAILTSALADETYPNLYAAVKANSPIFQAIVDTAGMKSKLSSPFNGTLLIPEEDAITRFVLDFGIMPNFTDKVECAQLVNFHLLPKTSIEDSSASFRRVPTALKGDDVEIYRSPYKNHTVTIFYQREGYQHLPFDPKKIEDMNWDGMHRSDVIKNLPVANSAAALVTDLLYPFDTIYAGGKGGRRRRLFADIDGPINNGSLPNVTDPEPPQPEPPKPPTNSSGNDGYADAFIDIPATKLCESLKWAQYANAECTVLAAVEYGLVSGSDVLLKCDKPNPQDYVLPQIELNPLTDLRPLPDTVPLSSISKQDGASMYWMYRMVENLADWATCAAANPATVFPVPQGWKVVKWVDLPQNVLPNVTMPVANPFTSIPFAMILQNDAKNHNVLLMRGTTSGFEWQVDFEYNRTWTYANSDIFPSMTHNGFAMVFSLVWPVYQQYLEENINNIKHISIGGHSLGGGVTQLMGYAVQKWLDGKQLPIIADAMAFAPPNVAGEDFVEEFNRKVNGRRIAYDADIVTQVPCTPDMYTCDHSSRYIEGWPVQTNMPGNVKSWQYMKIGGTVGITNKNMLLDNAWRKITSIPITSGTNIGKFLESTHCCALMCYLSKFSGSADTIGDECWLSEKQYENDPGSYCPGFENFHSWP